MIFPPGTHVITETINVPAKGQLRGSGIHETILINNVTNGSVINIEPTTHGADVGSFTIKGGDRTNTGIKAGTPFVGSNTDNCCRRVLMSDIWIEDCDTGIEGKGWINNFTNIHIHKCNKGAILDLQNGSNMDLKIENTIQAMIVKNSTALTMKLMHEGSGLNHIASTVDGSIITLLNPYFEFTNTLDGIRYKMKDYAVIFGGEVECKYVGIEGAFIDKIQTIPGAMILMDRVRSGSATGYSTGDTSANPIVQTQNCKSFNNKLSVGWR